MLKVAILAEKYAVDYTWYVDVILNLIRISGDYVSEEVSGWWRSLIIWIHLYSYNLYPQWWNLSIGLVLFLTKFLSFFLWWITDSQCTVKTILAATRNQRPLLTSGQFYFPGQFFRYICPGMSNSSRNVASQILTHHVINTSTATWSWFCHDISIFY